MPSGGKRPGAGRPKGTTGIKFKRTLDKEAAREALRVIVLQHMNEMVSAQIANARGLKSLIYRDKKTGKFVPVKVGQLEAMENHEAIEIWEDKPNVQAFTDLMNRAIDKPTEMIQQEVSLTIKGLDERLRNARKRVGKAG